MSGIGLRGEDLSGRNLSGFNLASATFDLATLTGADFSEADLTNASFARATLTGVDISGAVVRGADFRQTSPFDGFTAAQLYSTTSYQAHDLAGIGLSDNNLGGWNFAGQDLAHADFENSTLAGANLTGADIRGADFSLTTSRGFTADQLYSTASYQAQDLSGIDLSYGNDLSGWNFAGQNLTNARFYDATLTGADLTGADIRGTVVNYNSRLSDAVRTNLIGQDGSIGGLDLSDGQALLVRDYDGNPVASPTPTDPLPILVEQEFVMDSGSTLQMIFEGDAWDSLISFEPNIHVTLDGLLRLNFASSVDVGSQVGRTIDLFDWTGVVPTGAFAVASPYVWDVSHLHTTGEVTLLAVPETKSAALMIWITLALFCTRSWCNSPHRRFL